MVLMMEVKLSAGKHWSYQKGKKVEIEENGLLSPSVFVRIFVMKIEI